MFIYFLIDLFKRLEREYYAIFIYFDTYHAIFITNFPFCTTNFLNV